MYFSWATGTAGFLSYSNDSEKPCTINMIGVPSITAPVAAGGKMGYF